MMQNIATMTTNIREKAADRDIISNSRWQKREIGLLMLQVIAKGLDTTMDNLLKGL